MPAAAVARPRWRYSALVVALLAVLCAPLAPAFSYKNLTMSMSTRIGST
ncbi:MAG: hypothetical protein ACC669_09680 [bacterium]